jgi:1,4-alpha-glucan branching enzyme
MPGDRWQKFANLRAYFGFMWTHPARSSCSWAASRQETRLDHDHSLDWHLLSDPLHGNRQNYVRGPEPACSGSLPALHVND